MRLRARTESVCGEDVVGDWIVEWNMFEKRAADSTRLTEKSKSEEAVDYNI